jgi:hypothetical protein
VKTHQDDELPYEELMGDTRLKVHVNRLATWHREHKTLPQTRRQQTNQHAPGTAVSISISAIRLVSNCDSSTSRHINGNHSSQYIEERQDWDNTTFDNVDWYNCGQHIEVLPLPA